MENEYIIAEFALADGLIISVLNSTKHYYGGYYHVRLLAKADISLTAGMFDSQTLFDLARKQLGSSLCFQRVLEKMAVPECDVESVRHELLASFKANLLPYLSRKDFPSRFVLSEYEKYLKSGALLRGNKYERI